MVSKLGVGCGLVLVVTIALLWGTATSAQTTRTEPLFATCNNVALTHPAGTRLADVAAGITGEVRSIFRYDNAQMRFVGWAPGAPDFAVDYPTVSRQLEPVFICMNTAGQLVQPEFGVSPTSMATATVAPAATATATPSSTIAGSRPLPVIQATLRQPFQYVYQVFDGDFELPTRDEIEVCASGGENPRLGVNLRSATRAELSMGGAIRVPMTSPCLRLLVIDADTLTLTPTGAVDVRVTFVNCHTCEARLVRVIDLTIRP